MTIHAGFSQIWSRSKVSLNLLAAVYLITEEAAYIVYTREYNKIGKETMTK